MSANLKIFELSIKQTKQWLTKKIKHTTFNCLTKAIELYLTTTHYFKTTAISDLVLEELELDIKTC